MLREGSRKYVWGAALACIAGAGGALVAVGCSLGLDESKIGTFDGGGGGGEDGAIGGDGATVDGAGGDGGNPQPGPGACNVDSDCKSTSACVKAAHCDPDSKLCIYDVCTQ